MNNKIIVGHSLVEDFKSLDLNKDEFECELRDVAEFSKF